MAESNAKDDLLELDSSEEGLVEFERTKKSTERLMKKTSLDPELTGWKTEASMDRHRVRMISKNRQTINESVPRPSSGITAAVNFASIAYTPQSKDLIQKEKKMLLSKSTFRAPYDTYDDTTRTKKEINFLTGTFRLNSQNGFHRRRSKEPIGQAIAVEDNSQRKLPEFYSDVGDFIRKSLGYSKQTSSGTSIRPSGQTLKEKILISTKIKQESLARRSSKDKEGIIPRKLELEESIFSKPTIPSTKLDHPEDTTIYNPKIRKDIRNCFLFPSAVYEKPLESSSNCYRKFHRRTYSQQTLLNNSASKGKDHLAPTSGKHSRTPSTNSTDPKQLTSLTSALIKNSGDKEFDRLVSKMNHLHKIIVRKKGGSEPKKQKVPETIRLSNKAIKRGLIIMNKTIRGKAHTPLA